MTNVETFSKYVFFLITLNICYIYYIYTYNYITYKHSSHLNKRISLIYINT